MARNLSIAIVGGGIGGLSAALSLLRAGFDVRVYEQVPALREVGAGIVLTPNATRILHGLGLRKHLDNLGVPPEVVRQRRWEDGRTLLLAQVRRFVGADGEPLFFTSHRAEIQTMLGNALPSERLHLSHRLESFSEEGSKVTLRFANGEKASADILIGADGIHSLVRRQLFGDERPQFTGCVAYRGLVPMELVAQFGELSLESQLWLGPGTHFVNYPVSNGRLVNFVCLIDRDGWTRESWTEPGDPEDLRAIYARWHPLVRGLVDAVKEIFVWGLFDRPPLPRWSVGRVTMLGDACHPMLPFLAQGAAQAIEDGATLVGVLGQIDDAVVALRRYEELRKPRTAAIQVMARGNKTRNHLPDGPEQQARDAAMAAGAQWSIGSSDWIYRHDAARAAQTGELGLPPP